MLRLKHALVASLSATLVLSVVACGDDEDGAGNSSNTLVDVASADPQFSTLVAAVQRANLAETLNGAGPFTLFAPNNQAFIDAGITDVQAVPVEDLRQILLYHVISGSRVAAADVTAGPVLSAANLTLFVGTDAGVTLNGGNSVTGGAAVSATDVAADNGIIHVIDRVLLPPDLPACATYAGLSELTTAIGGAADLVGGTTVLAALQGEGPLTVFAPTNAAFQAIAAPADAAALRDVLLYHVVGSAVASNAIPLQADTLLQNTWGRGVSLLFDTASGVKVNKATVATADVRCSNGIVHVVDQVLLPPNVLDMVEIAGLQELAGAVGGAANLPTGGSIADALQAAEPYTVFAPTDAAFAALTATPGAEALRDILLQHVISAGTPVGSDSLPGTPTPTLASGQSLNFDASGPTVSSNGTSAANIVSVDINVTNGVIHLIDQVLLP